MNANIRKLCNKNISASQETNYLCIQNNIFQIINYHLAFCDLPFKNFIHDLVWTLIEIRSFFFELSSRTIFET